MKCFNLTDVETTELKKRGLLNCVLAVRAVLIKPGEWAEVPDDAISRRDAENYVKVGALAINTTPISYNVARTRSQSAPAPAAAPEYRKSDKKKKG